MNFFPFFRYKNKLFYYVLNEVNIQNHPSVLILSAIHHEIFTAGALEARVRRNSFQGTSWENRVTYGLLYQHTRVVLYLLYIQPKISFNCCIIGYRLAM